MDLIYVLQNIYGETSKLNISERNLIFLSTTIFFFIISSQLPANNRIRLNSEWHTEHLDWSYHCQTKSIQHPHVGSPINTSKPPYLHTTEPWIDKYILKRENHV